MDLRSLLQRLTKNNQALTTYRTLAFHGKKYPAYFFYNFIKKLKEDVPSLKIIATSTTALSHIIAQLRTSFLGSSCVYWLKNLNQLAPQKHKAILELVDRYTGPHTLIFYSSDQKIDQSKQNSLCIEVEQFVPFPLVETLSTFFSQSQTVQLKEYIKRKKLKLTLDEACLLTQYTRVVGKNSKQFFNEWFSKIVSEPPSLFSLSQYFFAKQPSKFFKYWTTIEKDYSKPFWITFWSDQLWHASFYVQFACAKDHNQAKPFSSRLPFSFLKHDWRNYTTSGELKQAHTFLYQLDYASKNAASSDFDLFYTKFFLEQFR